MPGLQGFSFSNDTASEAMTGDLNRWAQKPPENVDFGGPTADKTTPPPAKSAPAAEQPAVKKDDGEGRFKWLQAAAMLAPNNPAVQTAYKQALETRGMAQIGQAIMGAQQKWETGDHRGALETFDAAMANPAIRLNPQLYMKALEHRMTMGKQYRQTQLFQGLAAEIPAEGLGPVDFLKLAMKYQLDADFTAKMAPLFSKKDVTIHKGDHGEFIAFDGRGKVVNVYSPPTGLSRSAFSAQDHDNVRRASEELGFGVKYVDAYDTTVKAQQGDEEAKSVMSRAVTYGRLGVEQKISGETAIKLGRAGIELPDSMLTKDLPKDWEKKVAASEEAFQARGERRRGDITTRELIDREAAIRGQRMFSETSPGKVLLDVETGRRMPDMTTQVAQDLMVKGKARAVSQTVANMVGYADRAMPLVAQMRDLLPKILASAKNDKVKPFANLRNLLEYAAKKHFMSTYDIGLFDQLVGALEIESARAESQTGQGIAALLKAAVSQQVPGVWWDNTSSGAAKLDGLEANLLNLKYEALGKELLTATDIRKAREAQAAANGQIDPATLGKALDILQGGKKK